MIGKAFSNNKPAKTEWTDECRAELSGWFEFRFQVGQIGGIDDAHTEPFQNNADPQKTDRVEAEQKAKKDGAEESDQHFDVH